MILIPCYKSELRNGLRKWMYFNLYFMLQQCLLTATSIINIKLTTSYTVLLQLLILNSEPHGVTLYPCYSIFYMYLLSSKVSKTEQELSLYAEGAYNSRTSVTNFAFS